MRDVVLLDWLSLDGVSQEPSDWFFDDGPELFDLIGRVIATQDDVLLGRGTYDYWAGYWPTSNVEPFATFINSTHKPRLTTKRSLVNSPPGRGAGGWVLQRESMSLLARWSRNSPAP